MFYVVNEYTDALAAKAPEGKFLGPAFTTMDIKEAQAFDSWGEASDASQNFGPDWMVEQYD